MASFTPSVTHQSYAEHIGREAFVDKIEGGSKVVTHDKYLVLFDDNDDLNPRNFSQTRKW